jgi:GH25 family lysozyme M1 (1,4-beta-N-acetylmuramidase)
VGVRAIDVSVWQGAIDWRAVAASGVRGAWVKVGGADNPQTRNRGLYKDSRADENIAGATAAGIAVGTYWWCRPGGAASALEQAEFAVACGHGRGALWPGADLESNPHGLSHADYDAWASDFCWHVGRLTTRESMAYTFTGARVIGYSGLAPVHCPMWIANYGGNQPGTLPPDFAPGIPPGWARWHVWQFNDKTRIPGVTANTVDQNTVADDFWWLMIAGSVRRKLMSGTAVVDVIEATGVPGLWRYFVDGFGIERRVHVDSPAAHRALARIGEIDSVATDGGPAPAPPVVLHGDEAQWFASLEPANESRQSAEWATVGMLRAVVGQVLDERGVRVEDDGPVVPKG